MKAEDVLLQFDKLIRGKVWLLADLVGSDFLWAQFSNKNP
jgi:hypothetical protein